MEAVAGLRSNFTVETLSETQGKKSETLTIARTSRRILY